MRKLVVLAVFGVFLAASATLFAQGKDSWTGWVTDTHCGARGDNAKHADCAKKCVETMGAKYALYSPAEKKVYVIDQQEKAAPFAGKHVKVTGTVEGDTIKLASIEAVAEPKGKGSK